MNIRTLVSIALRKFFPSQMELRDFKRQYNISLQRVADYKKMTEDEIVLIMTKQYESITGNQLNLKTPHRFNEKIQWRKAYDHDPVYSLLSDKYAVREWVAKKIGDEYLIPILGVWDSEKKVPWNNLPDQFVLKTNNASSTNTIVTDKKKINRRIVKEKYRYWLNFPYGFKAMELHYNPIKPLIIAEQYMQPIEGETDLKDYKFICFDGKPCFVWVDLDRYHGHKRKVYSLDWKPQEWTCGSYGFCNQVIPKPEKLDEMIDVVKVLAKGFAHVRVDLYEIQGKVYFGEMTFTSCNGFDKFSPDEWDYKLGELWDTTKPQVDHDIVGI